MSAEMLLSRPRMNAYITARLALARADQNLGAEFAGSDEAFAKYIFRGHHAVAVAALRWLCAVLHGQDVASDFSVVSATQLPLKNRTPHWFSVALAEGSGVQIRLHPQRKGKAAGGRLCIDEVHPAIQKKGPDSWQVDVQMTTRSAGTYHCLLDPGPIGDLASANAVQHEDELADFAAEMFGIMPGDDDPSASLNLEESPSQPTVHCSTASTEDVTQRLQSLELNVSGMHVTLQAHDDKLDRLHGQMGEHTEDLIHVQVELATRTTPGAEGNSQSCSSDVYHPVGNSSLPSSHGQSANHQTDAPQTPVTFPQPRPHYRAPTPHTPCSASTVSCPPFSASLTHAQLRPAILTALAIHRPRSRSALDLSKMLWPENTPMRKAMNTMVKGVLYSDEMASKVEQNGTHWALKS
ncbi:hypothetical protein WJX79_004283 [Trebouxia sp. C0005]